MEFDKVFYTDNIPLWIDEKLLLTRLSYKKSKTESSSELLSEIKRISDIALGISKPWAAYTFVHLDHGTDNILSFENFCINSKQLSAKISDCHAVAFMAVTLGSAVDEKISDLISKDEYTCAVVLDAAASCIADSAVKGLRQRINNVLAEDNLRLSKFRISPGQLDIPFSMQKLIYDKLSLDKIGLSINDKMALSPQKSIISLTGISKYNTTDMY